MRHGSEWNKKTFKINYIYKKKLEQLLRYWNQQDLLAIFMSVCIGWLERQGDMRFRTFAWPYSTTRVR